MVKEKNKSFTKDVIKNDVLHLFHRSVMFSILDMIENYPHKLNYSFIEEINYGFHVLEFIPPSDEASKIKIEFSNKYPEEVMLSIGIQVSISIPTDLYGDNLKNPIGFLTSTILAIFDGNYTEILHVRNKILYKSSCLINFDDKQPFEFTRTNIFDMIKTILHKTDKKTIKYKSFFTNN